jgi:RES domain-containing protein
MYVWRIARGVYDPLDGEGARLYGGRWNPVGIPVAYTSAHLSLAVLEQLVHVDPEDLPEDLVAFEIEVPDDLLVETVSADDLPAGWNEVVTSPACREVGRRWAVGRSSPVLRVPSAALPQEVNSQEANYLINPDHPDAERVHVVSRSPFRFDPRLPGFQEV